MGLFDRLKQGLSKTRHGFVEKVESIFKNRAVDSETLEELEETLILSDVGAKNASEIVRHLREKSENSGISAGSINQGFPQKRDDLPAGDVTSSRSLWGKTLCNTDCGR